MAKKPKHFQKKHDKFPEMLKKRVRDEQAIMTKWVIQLSLDLMSDILNDRDVMGKDVFGTKRLTKIGNAFCERWPDWAVSLTASPEADAVRSRIDDRLRQIHGDEFGEWSERYEYFED